MLAYSVLSLFKSANESFNFGMGMSFGSTLCSPTEYFWSHLVTSLQEQMIQLSHMDIYKSREKNKWKRNWLIIVYYIWSFTLIKMAPDKHKSTKKAYGTFLNTLNTDVKGFIANLNRVSPEEVETKCLFYSINHV